MKYFQLTKEQSELTLDGTLVDKDKLVIWEDERLPYPVLEFNQNPIFDIEFWDEDNLIACIPTKNRITEAIYNAAKTQIFPAPKIISSPNFQQIMQVNQTEMAALKKAMNSDVWSSFQSILSVWKLNKGDLSFLLTKLHTDENLAIEMIQNVRESTIRDEVLRNLDRHIYNYLSSFKSVIEASRTLIARYENSQLVAKSKKFREPFDEIQFQFVDDLRKYVVHYDLPLTGQQLNFSVGEKMDFKLLADANRLLKFSGWDNGVKKFLAAQTSPIEIGRLLLAHMEFAQKQWDWLSGLQYKLHAFEIYKYNQCVNESNWALSGGREFLPRIEFS